MTQQRRKHTPTEREAFVIIGKGWSVGHNSTRSKVASRRYSAIVRHFDGRKQTVGCRDTKHGAAILAVQAARHYGTLDWSKTVRWFKTMDMELASEQTFGYGYAPKGKGWYVRKATTKIGTVMWIAYTGYSERKDGKSRHHLVTVTSRLNRKVAVEYAIKAALGTEHYNEAATVLWLERNGMDDLIPTAQNKRKVA
jgi:hypothetical protein